MKLTRLALLPLSLVMFAGARGADAPATDEVSTLRAENKQLTAELATAWKELDVVKGDLTAAQATAAKASDDAVALHKQLDAVGTSAATGTDAKKAATDLEQAKTDLAASQATAKNYSDEIALLKKQLDDVKSAPAAAPAASGDTEQLKSDLAAAKAQADTQTQEIVALKEQLASVAKPQDLSTAPATVPAAAPAADSDDAKKLADTQEKLEMALHSYTLLQDENNQLKTQVAQGDSDKANAAAQLAAANDSITSLKAQAEVAKQVDSLRTQLRQSQDELASLASDNAQLRTKIALSMPIGSNLRPTPIRPGSGELTQTALQTAAPVVAAPAVATPTATPAGPRTYVVAEGDTLSKISKQFYGTPSRWDEILKANKDTLKSDKSLKIGVTLKIP